MADAATTPSPRGTKRSRASGSPGSSPRRAGHAPPINAVDGTSTLVGSSRDLLGTKGRATDSEPTTEEEVEPVDARSGRSARGVSLGALPGQADGHGEDEPDTEASQDEEDGVIGQSAPLQLPTPGAYRPEADSRVSPGVLDLTDDGDDGTDALATRISTSRKLAASSSDEMMFVSAPITKRDKGKGRAVPTPSPSPSTQPPPSAENAAPTLPSLATLSCPICLGPPTPLALTSCGHAFCAPCLHAALVAGPALTPPPPDAPTTRGRGRGGSRGRARGTGARGGRGTATRTTTTGQRGWGNPDWHGAAGGFAGRDSENDDYNDDYNVEGDPDLNKHCPVCRTPLYGGWGKSLRGLVLRMAPKRD